MQFVSLQLWSLLHREVARSSRSFCDAASTYSVAGETATRKPWKTEENTAASNEKAIPGSMLKMYGRV